MSSLVEWPPSLVGTPTVAVIEAAIKRQRLSHSVLLHGDDHATLLAVAHAITDRLQNTADSSADFHPENHPDCFELRPKGKMRIIPIGKMQSPEAGSLREFLPKLYKTGSVSSHKVGIIHECDRMNAESANAFLKTLEEPPANTTLILLTTRPYALLPTIRSRVLLFRFPSAATPIDHPALQPWLADYQSWLDRLTVGVTSKRDVADHIFTLYGLIARFSNMLESATKEIWKAEKAKLPPDLADDEQVAIETGITNGLRLRVFSDLEHATSEFARTKLEAGETGITSAFVGAIKSLEKNVGLLRLNFNQAAALENFLLSSLRVWVKR